MNRGTDPGPARKRSVSSSTIIRTAELAIDTGELGGGRITIAVNQRSTRPMRLLEGKAISFQLTERATADRGVEQFELHVPPGAKPRLAPEHLPRISGIDLRSDSPVVVQIEWSPTEQLQPRSTYTLRVLQFEDETPHGGSTFVIRRPSKRRD